MNKSRYCVVFNKKTGVFAAVSELAKRRTKSTISGNSVADGYVMSGFFTRFSKLAICIALLCNGINVVSAQVIAATNTPQKPTVTTTQNHVTNIQIVAPNSAGVSHNQYQHFDINQQGAILSNNPGVANTQLGGWVAPNPHLHNSAPAKVIVNEVTSTDKSVLKGYLEVAGQRADVIVSNPNGITVGNFGVINGSRTVLTTGTPIFGGAGSLDAFRVVKGDITTTAGSKLNNKDIEQTDLIARSVQVNGELWGKNLNVVTGANQVKYDDLDVTVIAGLEKKPQVAIDVAALGGMYANKINLVSNEAGVGVANYGAMVSGADDIHINANGKVIISGKTASSKDIVIHAHDDVLNQKNGVLRAKNNIELQTSGDLKNTGLISSDHETAISSKNINNTGRIYGEEISLHAKDTVNNNKNKNTSDAAGVVAAHDKLTIGAREVNNSNDALLLTEHGALTIHGADGDQSVVSKVTNASAKIDAGSNLTVNANVFNNINTEYQTGETSSQKHIVEYVARDNTYSSDKAMIVNEGKFKEVLYTADPNKTIQEYYAQWLEEKATHKFLPHSLTSFAYAQQLGKTADYYINDYIQTTTETTLTSSKSGEVIAHGDVTLSGKVTNDKSIITASGAMRGSLEEFNNIDGKGSVIVNNDGTSTQHGTQSCTASACTKDKDGDPTPINDPIAEETTNLVEAKKIENDETLTKTLVPEDKAKETLLSQIDSQLYHKAEPGKGYLIETDPSFTNYATFMSSDYLLSALGIKDAKHLGDGYYEQKMVMDQIIHQTGHRDLNKDVSAEEQYKELMDAALAVKDQLHLQTGVGLTADQQKSLSRDIVWMVSQKIKMPNGTMTEVLSPVVYLAHDKTRQQPGMNAIVSANNIAIKTKNTISNSGQITAHHDLDLASEKNITNSYGEINSTNAEGKVSLHAKENIENLSGQISGTNVDINADKNVTIATNVKVNQGANATNINLDGVADISAGDLKIQSGKNIVTSAANINAANKISMNAKENLDLGATTTRQEKNFHGDLGSHVNKVKEQTNGTQIYADGDISLTGTNGVTTQAANVESNGKLQVMSDKDVVIGDASQHMSTDINDTQKDNSLLTHHYQQDIKKTSEEMSDGSSLSGDSVHIAAGHDVNVAGSEVIASNDVKVDANNDIAITAGRNVYAESTSHTEKTSGLTMDGGGVNIGKESGENKQELKQVTHNSSSIASLNGNVSMIAGQHYGQSGSNVLASQGDIKIAAKNVDIVHEKDTVDSNQSSKHEKIGVSAGVTSDVVSSIQGIQNTVSNYKKTDSKRAKALAALTAGSQIYDLASMSSLRGVDASVSVGASKDESQSEQHDSTVQSSTVKAGGNITIEATGADKDSDVTIIGSDIQAGKNTSLKADNRVDILAGQNTHSSSSSNKSLGASVGYSLQKGWNGSLSAGHGTSDGDSVSQTNSHVQSGQNTDIKSGADTTIQGGVISGKLVNADVGGDLNIESLQDRATYDSEQKSAGIDISQNQGAGANLALSKTDGTYAAVDEQSGIKAGDDGFHVHVKGNTDLKGAVIASSEKAANDGANNMITGTLTVSDIKNHDEHQSSSFSASIATGGGSSAGIAQDKHTQKPTITASGVSAGQIAITNQEAQQQKNNKTAENTISDLKRDVTSEKDGNQKLSQSWSEESLRKEQEDVDAQAKIMQVFGAQAAKEIGSAASGYSQKLKQKADLATDPKEKAELMREAAKWDEGGSYRIALHMVAGALAGNVNGALGAGASAYSSNAIKNKLDEMNIRDSVKGLLGQALEAGIGAAVGGASGGVASVNQYANNRMLHDVEKEALAQFQQGKSEEEKLRLSDAACYLVKCAAGIPDDDPRKTAYSESEKRGAQYSKEQKMFDEYGQKKLTEAMRQNAELTTLVASMSGTIPIVDEQMFAYTGTDLSKDLFTRNKGPVRTAGFAQGVLGSAGVVGGTATAETGIGVAGAVVSADYAAAGFTQAWTGIETATYGQQGLQAAGMSEETAAVVYPVLGGGLTIGAVGISLSKTAPTVEEAIIGSSKTVPEELEGTPSIKEFPSVPVHSYDDVKKIIEEETKFYGNSNYNVPDKAAMENLERVLTKDAVSKDVYPMGNSAETRTVYTLKDGGTVQVRTASKTGGKTLDIKGSEQEDSLRIHIDTIKK